MCQSRKVQTRAEAKFILFILEFILIFEFLSCHPDVSFSFIFCGTKTSKYYPYKINEFNLSILCNDCDKQALGYDNRINSIFTNMFSLTVLLATNHPIFVSSEHDMQVQSLH